MQLNPPALYTCPPSQVLRWPSEATRGDYTRSREGGAGGGGGGEARRQGQESASLLPRVEEEQGGEQDLNVCAFIFSRGCSQRWCFSGDATPPLQHLRSYSLGKDVVTRRSSISTRSGVVAPAVEEEEVEAVVRRKLVVAHSVMVHPIAPGAGGGGGAHVGCKVLPLCDLGSAQSECGSGRRASMDSPREDQRRRARTVGRMRELWRKAAATSKIPKGAALAVGWKVSHLLMNGGEKSRARAPAPTPSSDAMSTASSKISFRWDAGSNCSGESSSVYSLPCAAPSFRRSCDATRRVSTSLDSETAVRASGHWITTDSEFVVLEL